LRKPIACGCEDLTTMHVPWYLKYRYVILKVGIKVKSTSSVSNQQGGLFSVYKTPPSSCDER
jgi:hypothetical protein